MCEQYLAAEVALPELAVSRAAGHGAQQERVDLNHLLHRLRSCSAHKCSHQAAEQACDRTNVEHGRRALGVVKSERTDVGSHAGPRVDRHDDTSLKDEGQRGGAMIGFHQLHHLALKRVHLQSSAWNVRTTCIGMP